MTHFSQVSQGLHGADLGRDISSKTSDNAAPGSAGSRRLSQLSIIDRRALERMCLAQCLTQQGQGFTVLGYESIEAWSATPRPHDGHEAIFYHPDADAGSKEARDDLVRLVQAAGSAPVIVLAAEDDPEAMFDSIDCGAAGHFSPHASLEDLIDGACVAFSGGIFLPRESLKVLRSAISAGPAPKSELEMQFTARQLAVAHALRRGEANKTIAYKLNLCESTVKVHIRKIMRTLNATNRTQAAFKLNSMLGGMD